MSNEHAQTGGEGTATDGRPTVPSERPTTTDLDSLFEVLADGHRRRVLDYLDDTDDEVATFSDLVDHVADRGGEETPADRDRIAVNLHHNHLPKLESAGVLEWDPRSEMVRYRGGPVVGEWVELALAHESDSE